MAIVKRRKYFYTDFTSEHVLPMTNNASGAVMTAAAAQTDSTFTSKGDYLEVYQDSVGAGFTNAIPTANGLPLVTGTAGGLQFSTGIVSGIGPSFTVGTDPAFFIRAKFKIGTVANHVLLGVCLRKTGAYASGTLTEATIGTKYTDTVFLGVTTIGGAYKTSTTIGGAAATLTALAKAAAVAADVVNLQINVSSAGAVTYLVNGAADANAVAATMGAIEFVPGVIVAAPAAVATDSTLQEFEFGYL